MTTYNAQMTWWTCKLSEQRERISFLLRRLTGFGEPGGMNLKIFRKFVDLLDQVALARKQELHYLDRIEAVEQQHKRRRELHLLRHYDPAQPGSDHLEQPQPEPPRPQLAVFLLFWYLFVCKAINHKKQGLTVD